MEGVIISFLGGRQRGREVFLILRPSFLWPRYAKHKAPSSKLTHAGDYMMASAG